MNIVFYPENVESLPNSVLTISWGIASVVPGLENDVATLVLAADIKSSLHRNSKFRR
ncbi:hypothetical protein [Tychonema sp. LEGE 07203]|uniref:hypothetical protein n=1 Tax=Tychonema sp. LEGE 07203 TaxID=1828671 RepID=UPI001880774C|nr:hypothetical protein [Tychonema sp. LEGE 07203]MBE9095883.1 hypothetical protein [Tychonema sp. LEGE 07203]